MRWLSVGGACMVAAVVSGCEPDIAIVDKAPVEEPIESDIPVEIPGEALLDVTPRMIDFGYVEEGTVVDGEFTVRNLGDEDLLLTGLLLQGSATFALASSLDVTVAPGASEVISVSYASEADFAEAELSFATNDLGFPTVDLELVGNGANPLLTGEPLDFGEVLVDTTETRSLPVHNPGNYPVTLRRIMSDDGHFTVDLPASVMIDPGDTLNIDVSFLPTDAIAYAGTLTMDSDARVVPDTVTVLGEGVSEPVAVCGADPPVTTAIHGSFHFDATGSYDPAGRPLTAQWQLVSVPQGSNVTLPAYSGVRIGPITPDVVGDYTAQVIVTNDLGVSSEPCLATATAEVDADLWVEMTWQHAEDIDLHLLRNNASMNTSGDCYWANCTNGLSWDGPGTADDPVLDLDDTTGTGPENINIADPAANRYKVVIHDFPGGRHSGTNNVRVRVYLAGALLLDETRQVTGEGDTVDVALIDWTVSPPVVTSL